MRVGGLASGMDIDSIVADLMKAERMPLDKLKQQKQTLEWKRDDYRSMNTLLLDFRSELTQYKLTTKYRARMTASSDESKVTATATSAASQASYTINNVTGLASAANRVSGSGGSNGEKLSASGKNFNPSKGLYGETGNFDNGSGFTWSTGVVGKQTLKTDADSTTVDIDLAGSKFIERDKMSVKVNGKSFEVVTATPAEGLGANQVLVEEDGKLTFSTTVKKDTSIQVEYITDNKNQTFEFPENKAKLVQLANGSIHSLELDVNGAKYTLGATDASGNTELVGADSSVIGTINKETGLITFNEELDKGATISASYTQNYSTFSLKTFTKDGEQNTNFFIQGNESLNAVMSKVNSSTAGVSMLYDSFSDRVTMTRSETGDFNKGGDEITTDGDFLNSLLKFGNSTETGGTNVRFEINGLKTERYSNTFEMSGVTFTIKDTFDSSKVPNGVTTTVQNNTTDVFDNIKSFVDKYNALIDTISKKTSEEYYRSYGPLTDSQREGLTDKQQEQWEEKAKSGLLRRDPMLNSVLSAMRMNMSQPVNNAETKAMYKQLSSIGVSTTANYLEGGKLQIDEAKLKKAIEEDPTAVENLFRGGSGATNESEKGIIHRLYDSVNNTMTKLKDKAGNVMSTASTFALGRELKNVDTRIDSFEARMKQVEDRYWRQFTAMEKAIQQANNQSAYLMQQFSM